MNPPLRIVHLEDDVRDGELVRATLEAEGIQSELTRVETEPEFVAALKQRNFHLILADYTLPSFDGLSALKIAQQHAPDVPFIFVSGTLGEDVATEALKTGATDYILKTRLTRMGPAIARALGEAREKVERKRAEEALCRSEREFRMALDTIPALAWSTLPDGPNEYCNKRWMDYTGMKPGEELGYGWLEAFHPDDRSGHFAKWRAATEAGEMFESVARIRRADGEYRWFLTQGVPLRDESGKIVRWYGTNVNIDERKRAEEALRKSEAYLAEAQTLSHTGSWAFKPVAMKMLYWSEELFRTWGFDPQKGPPDVEAVLQRIHPEDRERIYPLFERGLKGQLTDDTVVDHRIALPDGTVKYVHGISHPVFDEAGQVIEYVGTSVDVTEEKRAEEALRRSEAYLAEAQKLTLTGNWAWDPRTDKMLYCSDELFRIYEMDRQGGFPTIEDFLQRVHPEDRDRIKERSVSGASDGIEHGADYRLLLPDGRIKHVLSIRQSISNDAGEVVEVLGTLMDISEGKRAEALFAGEKRLLEMIATDVALKEILNALCRIIEEYRSGALASILLLRPDGQHLDSVAGPSLPKSWRLEMERLPIGPCAGSCGTAAYRGSAVIVSDIATDPLWEVPEHRAAALGHGLRASWSNPILSSDGKVLGTFCIYGRETQSPSPRDLELIEKATYLARVAIERDRAELALRTSEEKYRDLINASPDAICVIDADGKNLLVNPAAVKLAGRSEEELIGSLIVDTYLPEERHLLEQRIERLKAEGSFRFERKFVRKNGDVIPVEVSLSALRGRYYQSIIRDISQRKRREALLAGENRVLEMVAKGDSLSAILDRLCLMVEEQSSGVLASILLIDVNGKQLRHGSAPNLPKAYTDAIDGAYVGPSVGSCGTAAYRGEQVIVSDIATDPLWADFRDLALGHSLRACWSTPIFSSEGKVIGTFAMYYRQPRSPSPQKQDTIKHITHLAGIAIERKLAERARRESEAYLEEAQRLSHTGSWAWEPSAGDIRYWSAETFRILGFDPHDGPPKFETLVQRFHPEDQGRVKQLFEDAIRNKADFETDHRVVHPNGDVRELHVVGHPISDEIGDLVEFVGTVIDVTEAKHAEEALRASEQVARGQVEAMTYSLDVLATAPAPEKFLGEMLSTIGRLLDAQSVILWLWDEAKDSLALRAWAEGENFEKADPEHPFIKDPLSWKEDSGLQEMFFAGAPVACEDVEYDPDISSALREYLWSGGTRKFLRIPILVAGQVKGFIGIRHEARPPYRPEEIELAQALAHQVMLALQLNEFAEQGRQTAILAERNRMARDIHDTLAQGFTGVIIQLEAVADAISCGDHKEAEKYLQRASDLARRSLNEARRSVHALRPAALQGANFWDALKGIIKNTTAGSPICTKTRLRGKLPALPPDWEENLMHIGQEALTNALKYAHADNFETQLICNAKELRLEFQDDGDGFTVKDGHDGFGLAGMRERVEQMGGELKITSARGKGTKVSVVLSLNGE